MRSYAREMLFVLAMASILVLAVVIIMLNTAPNPNGPNLPVWVLKTLCWLLPTPLLLYFGCVLNEVWKALRSRLTETRYAVTGAIGLFWDPTPK